MPRAFACGTHSFCYPTAAGFRVAVGVVFLMLILSILAVNIACRDKWNRIGLCFLAGGMITNFMDFLTTETLTLTVPLILVLWIARNQNESISFSLFVSTRDITVCNFAA